jgi:hypothetical protein
VAEHVKRTTQVLSIAEAIGRFMTTRQEASNYHSDEIRVEAGWTKTHRARVIPLQPNALEWVGLVAAQTAKKARLGDSCLQPRLGTIDGDVGRKRQIRRCLSPSGSAKMIFYAILTARIGQRCFESIP